MSGMRITKLWNQKIELLLKYDKRPIYNHPYYGIVYNNAEEKCGMIKEDFKQMKGLLFNISHTKDYKHRIIQFYKNFEDYTLEEFELWLKLS